MLYYTSRLKNYNIDATDGEMGKIEDLYFDDEKWALRYAVVDSRKWLPSKRVLLSPTAFINMNDQKERVEVEYDKDTIRNSPSVPEDVSITKDLETSLAGYYGWNQYWAGSMLWGVQDSPINNIHDDAMVEGQLRDELQMNENKEHSLRSEDETLQANVHADDGKLGQVVDMIVDDEKWKIHYVVLELDSMPIGDKFFVIKPENIQSVDWFEGDIYAEGKLESLKQQKGYPSKEKLIVSV